jgi:drug/metabolite transporter (DMT)-like permease
VAIALALAAAFLFSLGTVLQQQVAAALSEAETRSAGFLVRLARRRRWLAGVAADAVGFVAQAGALAAGRLVVVQPLQATTLVLSLPLGAWLNTRRIGRRQGIAALVVTAALGVFLVAANPAGGREDVTTLGWMVAFPLVAAICGGLLLGARGRRRAHRAALVGAAAGSVYGLSAALTKATVERLDEGVLGVLGDWHLYALVVVGYASMTLTQISLQAGALAPAVATQSTLNPIASLLLGTLAFHERLHESPAGRAAALLALAAMIGGLVVLAMAQQAGTPPRLPRRPSAL